MKVAWWLCRDQSREQRGQMWKYSARANLREDSKDKSAITAQENTDRPLLAKSAITIKQIVIFAISPNFQQHSTLPKTLVFSATSVKCRMEGEGGGLTFVTVAWFENQFWLQCIFENRLTVPRKVWTPHARLVWWTDKYRGKNLCIHLHSVDAYSYLRIDLNTCFVCLHLTGRKSFNELGGGTFDLSQTFYARFYVCFSIWPAKDLK